jgi:hypothetical protein
MRIALQMEEKSDRSRLVARIKQQMYCDGKAEAEQAAAVV